MYITSKHRIRYFTNKTHMVDLHIAEYEKDRPRGKLLEYCKENNIDPQEIVRAE